MKVKLLIMILAVCALLAPISAQAQGLNGKNEFAVTGAWFSLSGGNTSLNLAAIAGSYGRFLTPNIEVGLPIVFGTVHESGTDLTLWALDPEVSYYFLSDNATSPIAPYIGLGATYVDVNGNNGFGTHTSTNFTYYAGLKYFLGKTPATSDKALFLEYRHLEFDFGNGSSDVKADGVWAGMSFFM